MKTRSLAIVVLTVLAVGGGLWGIWMMESGWAAGGTQGDGEEFSYQLKNKGSDSTTDILIMCPEEIMAEPGQAFSEWLVLDGIPVNLPGGAMLLARLNDVTLDDSLKPAQRSLVEVLKRYSPRRVVLVAHTFCVYYDTVAAWNNDLAGVRQRQLADLTASVEVLRGWFPRSEVSAYLAEEDSDHKMVFRSLDKFTP
jgi:hypothetical protein